MRDGVAIAEAGAFSLVIEGVAESLARELTAAMAVPTIGIGGSPACYGQILVVDDMLGLFTEFTRNSSNAIAASATRSARPPTNMPRRCARAASPQSSTPIRRGASLDFSQSEIQVRRGSLERVGEANRRGGASTNGSGGAR